MKKEKVRLPLIYYWITGAIGKEFVIKHYKYGPVKTKYPDMTKIIASEAQCKCRNLFREAVAYAKEVMKDPVRKSEWERRIRRKNLIWPKIIRFYMLEAKRQKQAAKQRVIKLIHKCFNPNYRNKLAKTIKIDSNDEVKGTLKDHHLLKREQLYYCK